MTLATGVTYELIAKGKYYAKKAEGKLTLTGTKKPTTGPISSGIFMKLTLDNTGQILKMYNKTVGQKFYDLTPVLPTIP